jgi:hypothetical protein
MTFRMETLVVFFFFFFNLKILLKNPHIYEIVPIELFVDMKNLQKFVEVACRTMLGKN